MLKRTRLFSVFICFLIVVSGFNLLLQISWLGQLLATSLAILRLSISIEVLLHAWRVAIREKSSVSTWEAFVVTGVDASTGIQNKFLQTLKFHFLTYALLATLSMSIASGVHGFPINPSVLLLTFPSFVQGVNAISLILGSVLIYILTFSQLAFFVAVGLLAGSLSKNFPPSSVSLLRRYGLIILLTNTVFLVAFALFSQYALYLRRTGINPQLFSSSIFDSVRDVLVLAIAVMIDAGAISLTYLFYGLIHRTENYLPATFTPVLIILIYVFWTLIALKLSKDALIHQGLLRRRK